ncbi:hypothetical protein [Aurantibacillus circumpalustris]|uniref:hypothetical protein n=1 Tax=Aurantibacillus circumpalustris TaxID=3036359 RepID=UPI00295AD937|nr:hypothetical protein [Aurantibacillus circumpalustris]
MMLRFITFCFLTITSIAYGQINCETAFVTDTMSVPETEKILQGQYLEIQLKDFSMVRIFRTNDDKYFLRFIVKQNFYFDKVDVLEIRSGSKSYYVKNTKQFKIDKTSGLFVVEVFKNYISTLKEAGITSLYFAKSVTDFTRQDASRVKQISKCLYDFITEKNKN